MRWFDLGFLEELYERVRYSWYLWKRYPNPKERKKARREIRKEARALVDDALRREAWAAGYENRPKRSIQEVCKELREQLTNRTRS